MTQSVKYQLCQTNKAKYFVTCYFLTSHAKLLPEKLQQPPSGGINFAIIDENSKCSYQNATSFLEKKVKGE